MVRELQSRVVKASPGSSYVTMGSAAPHVMNSPVDEFVDGFGVRLRAVDPTGPEPLEFLRF